MRTVESLRRVAPVRTLIVPKRRRKRLEGWLLEEAGSGFRIKDGRNKAGLASWT